MKLTLDRDQVGSDDPDHGGVRPQPGDSAWEDHWRVLCPVRGLYLDIAHPYCGQQLCNLL